MSVVFALALTMTSDERRCVCDGTTCGKELVHIDGWLTIAESIVSRGEAAYLSDSIAQEAGDSVMIKLGEAAKRLAQFDVLAPPGVEWALAVANRNFIVHQYDEINRRQTWLTLQVDLAGWRTLLRPLMNEAKQHFQVK